MADNEATLLLKIKQIGADALDKVTESLDAIKGAALLVAGAIAAFTARAVMEFKKSEEATNSLNQAMVQQGMYTTELASKYNKMAEALSEKTRYDDDEVRNSIAIVQGYTKQKEVSEGLMKAIMDLAARKKMDLASAAELVGRTVSTETNALARQGIELENVRDKTARTAEVVQKLNSQFGGSAEAMGKGLGSLDLMHKAFDDMSKLVGGRLAPVIELMATGMTNLFKSVEKGSPYMDAFMAFLQAIGQQGVMIARDMDVLGKVIGNVIGGISGAMSELIGGNFKAAWDQAKSIVSVSADDIVKSNETMNERLKALDDAFLAGKSENLVKDEENIKASNERKRAIEEEESNFKKEDYITKNAEELEQQAVFDQIAADSKLMRLQVLNDKINSNNVTSRERLQAEMEKERIYRDAKAKVDIMREEGVYRVKAFLDSEQVKNTQQILGTISSLQNSHSKELVAVGKAAAIAQAIINTAQGVTLALATFPGPFGIALGALVAAAGAIQIGTIAGVQMAEGGIVTARPGGMQATIGEGGRDEAVIPLDSSEGQSRLGGGGSTINLNGVMMIDETQAARIAKIIDEELLKLRQSNQSKSFDSDIV